MASSPGSFAGGGEIPSSPGASSGCSHRSPSGWCHLNPLAAASPRLGRRGPDTRGTNSGRRSCGSPPAVAFPRPERGEAVASGSAEAPVFRPASRACEAAASLPPVVGRGKVGAAGMAEIPARSAAPRAHAVLTQASGGVSPCPPGPEYPGMDGGLCLVSLRSPSPESSERGFDFAPRELPGHRLGPATHTSPRGM